MPGVFIRAVRVFQAFVNLIGDHMDAAPGRQGAERAQFRVTQSVARGIVGSVDDNGPGMGTEQGFQCVEIQGPALPCLAEAPER